MADELEKAIVSTVSDVSGLALPHCRRLFVDIAVIFMLNKIGGSSMALTITNEAVPLRADADGVIRVGGTRVTLDTVIAAFSEGATAEEIAQQYPSLNLADVYLVISYYLRHSGEVEAYLSLRRAQADAVQTQNESRFDPVGVRGRLLARRALPR